MVKNATVVCKNGYIWMRWEWEDDKELESISIYYKKSEILEGDGSSFLKEAVVPAHNMAGSARRQIENERGLYTFTIVPRLKDGSAGEKILIKDIMLGDPIHIQWSIQKQKENMMLKFHDFMEEIPAGVVFLENGTYKYQLNYKVNKDTVLFFPQEVNEKKIKLYAKEPYNKLYYFGGNS